MMLKAYSGFCAQGNSWWDLKNIAIYSASAITLYYLSEIYIFI